MLERLDRGLSIAEDTFISVMLITASAILFVNVVGRYVFNYGFVWAEELVRYEIIWLVFVGGSVAARKGIHIGVDAIVHLLPAPLQKLVNIAVLVLCIAFCAILAFYGWELVAQTRAFNQQTPAMQAPFWLMQLAIPVGAMLMGLRFTQSLVTAVTGREARHETSIIN
jgi:C4-dicarboxylate transporter DctQ subunit